VFSLSFNFVLVAGKLIRVGGGGDDCEVFQRDLFVPIR